MTPSKEFKYSRIELRNISGLTQPKIADQGFANRSSFISTNLTPNLKDCQDQTFDRECDITNLSPMHEQTLPNVPIVTSRQSFTDFIIENVDDSQTLRHSKKMEQQAIENVYMSETQQIIDSPTVP